MNAEELARLYNKVSREEMKSLLGEEKAGKEWNELSATTQEIMLRTAERVLEQVQAPIQSKLEEVLGTKEEPRMVISVDYTGDTELDGIRAVQTVLNNIDNISGKNRVLEYVTDKINDSWSDQ